MRSQKELSEMPKGDLVSLAKAQGEKLAKKGKETLKSKSHVSRAIARRVGTGLAAGGVVGLEYGFKNTSPRLVKWGQGGMALAAIGGAVVADVLGAEPLAGALDGAGAVNLGSFISNVIRGRKPGNAGAQGPSNSNPPQAGETSETGDMWQGNTLPFDGTGAQPAPAASRGNRPMPNRPLLHLARRDGRFLKAIRYGLARQELAPSAANVGAILEAADSVVGEEVAVDPNTGEYVSLIETSGETGALSPLAVALQALRQLGPLMTQLDSLPDNPPEMPKAQGTQLTDDELALAAVAGLLDPEDVAHVMTSGMDDGVYLSAAGGEVTAKDVREDMGDGWETGSVSDRWQAYKSRNAYKKREKERRQKRRLDSKAKREKSQQEKKAAELEAKLDRKEARLERRTTQATNRLGAQNAAETQAQTELEQQGKDLAESSLPAQETVAQDEGSADWGADWSSNS